MKRLLVILFLLFSFNVYSQCPNNLNGNNNNPTLITVYVYNSLFQIIGTILCNTNPSGQVNCDLNEIPNGVYYSISNTTCIYNTSGVLLPNVHLPIELISIDAEKYNNYNIINWVTASENNNDYFIVEKSTNGIDWFLLSEVDGSGTTSEVRNYSIIDYYKYVINYYRLSQVDCDGDKQVFEEIVSVDNRMEDKKIKSIINLLGQEVNLNTNGILIITYLDGTTIKIFN